MEGSVARVKTEPEDPADAEVKTEVPWADLQLRQSPVDIKQEFDDCPDEEVATPQEEVLEATTTHVKVEIEAEESPSCGVLERTRPPSDRPSRDSIAIKLEPLAGVSAGVIQIEIELEPQEGDRAATPSNAGLQRFEKQYLAIKERFKCRECGKCFRNSSHLKRHDTAVHTAEKIYSCPHCDEKFAKIPEHKKHLKSHLADRPFICSECNQNFPKKCHLKTHLKTHSGLKPFSCSECDYKCIRLNDLHKHLRTHTGEKPFSCSVCGIKFTVSSALVRHHRTHTGEKSLSCKECEYKCSDLSNFKRHLRMHTGEKPFECSDCDKTYADSSLLKLHRRKHTGDQVFVCSVCGVTFNRAYNLKKHRRLHTAGKKFACTLCELMFSGRSHLKSHMIIHNSEDTAPADASSTQP